MCNLIVEGIREEIKSRIPDDWKTYHSPLCGSIACDEDCPAMNYKLYGIWRLWNHWKEIHERQSLIAREHYAEGAF